jgi:hypothetical protein
MKNKVYILITGDSDGIDRIVGAASTYSGAVAQIQKYVSETSGFSDSPWLLDKSEDVDYFFLGCPLMVYYERRTSEDYVREWVTIEEHELD